MDTATDTVDTAPPPRRTEGLGELFKNLREETTMLLRQEVALVKTEVSEKINRTGSLVSHISLAGLVACVGLVFLLVALNEGLEVALIAAGLESAAHWLAPLITGALFSLIGGVWLKRSLAELKNESVVPKKTLNSLKEDKQWIQEKMK